MEQIQSASNLFDDDKLVRQKSKNKIRERRNELMLLAFLSAALFGNEVLMTRYFSTVINVNMVYFVVSAALFGTGLGAYIAHNALKDKNTHFMSVFISRNIYLLALAIALFWGFALIGPYVKGYTIYIIGSSLTFIFGGMVMSALYMKHAESGHEFYFADMFGAVLGCILVVAAMVFFEFYTGLAVVFFTTAIALLASNETENRNLKYTVFITLVILGGSFLSSRVIENMNKDFDAYYKNPNKGVTYIAEAYKSDVEIIYSHWGAFSRTDVVKLTNDDHARYILTDGSASAPIINFDGDLSKLDYMKSDVAYLPYLVGSNDRALLIGSGGGKDVIYALLSGSEDITAVEINEGTIAAVNDSKDFSGDIYNQKGVRLVVGDGRKFVDETTETFDHIYLSMLMSNAIDNSRLSLVENYIFTEEAFDSYKNALKPNGRISFMVHNGIEAVRVANTWIKTLMDAGIPERDVNKYFVIVNGMKNHGGQAGSIHMPSVILKKTPFTEEELTTINDFNFEENVSAVHLPYAPNELYYGLDDGTMTYEDVISQLDINVTPVKDASPFFYKYSNGLPPELFPLIFLLGVIGTFLISKAKKYKASVYHSSYFMMIGMGYIIVELGFIQSLQRYLEKPIFSFTLVLVGMLTGSALGALMSGKFALLRRVRDYSALVVGITALSGYYWLSLVTSQTMMLSIMEKLGIVLPVIMIVGFFMGMPFPYIIEKMAVVQRDKEQIPLMYALNGYASILGSVIALTIALNFGFASVVIVGSGIYVALGVLCLSAKAV